MQDFPQRMRWLRRGILPLLLAAAGLAAGCATWIPEPRRQAAHEREDFLILRDDIRRLEGRIEGVEMETGRLRTEAEEIRRLQETVRQSQAASLHDLAQQLEHRIQALEAAREKDRQDIVQELSRQMAALLQSRRSAGRRSGGAETGYEHEVQPGDTLSTIAAAYDVPMQTIQDANQISNPDRLRAGTILFIPAP